EYNGYKVYWEDGAQITAPKDEEIIAEVNAVSDYSIVKTMDLALAKEQKLNHTIGKEIDDKYIEEIKKYILNPLSDMGKKLKIVYTPIHGSGITLVPRILKELGFENVYIVEEQEEPDSSFPTVSYPNPEDPEVYELALKLAKKVDADIILATDPDADRIGIQVKNAEGEYELFSGNMIGEIMLEYILSQRKIKVILPTNGAIVKTVVSSNMVDKMAEAYGAELFEVLTGFKYIGEKIKEFRESGSHEYLFGFEESYGFLIGTYARDKDAVSAVMVLCEAAAYYKDQGFTFNEQIDNIRRKYGYFHEDVFSAAFKGISGMEKMKEIMTGYREDAPSQIGEFKVIKVRDYLQETITNIETNEVKASSLPKSDVLYFELEDDAWCAVRPSGTEPKIKIYFGVKGTDNEDAEEKIQSLMNDQIFAIGK
ncbi:MAG TPA: phospho-sugar mutase, partial [Clostridiales bacterium]|nr:phospho-sugar mutase [Clostridiales bacterium]